MKNHGIKSIAVNSSYLFASQGISILTKGIYAIVLARFLGPEVYGIFNYGFSWYLAFMPITMLGLNFILSREVGPKRPGYKKVVAQTLALRSIASASIALLCGIIGWYIESEPVIRQIIIIFSFALFGRGLSLWVDSVFIAYEKSQYLLRLNSLFRLLEVTIGIIALLNGGGLVALALVHTLSYWLQGTYGLILVRRHLLPVYPDWNFKAIKSLLITGIPFIFALFFAAWLAQGPLIMYRHLLDVDINLGQLALALQILFLLKGIPFALAMAALPVLSRAVERKDGKDFVFMEGMLRAGIILGTIAAVSGMALGPLLIPLIFGEHYSYAGNLLGYTLGLLIPIICSSAMGQVIIARGRYKISTLCYGLAALSLLATFPYFIKNYDAYGAIIATGIAYVILAICQIIVLYNIEQFDLDKAIFRPLLSVFVSVGIYYLIQPFSIYLAMLCSILFLITLSYIFGVLSQAEKIIITHILKEKIYRTNNSKK